MSGSFKHRDNNTSTQSDILMSFPFRLDKIFFPPRVFITIHIADNIGCYMCISTCQTGAIIFFVNIDMIVFLSHINRVIYRTGEITPCRIICILFDHTTVLGVNSFFRHLLCCHLVNIGYANSQTKFKRIGKTNPFFHITLINVVGRSSQTVIRMLIQHTDRMIQFFKEFIINFLFRIIRSCYRTIRSYFRIRNRSVSIRNTMHGCNLYNCRNSQRNRVVRIL